MSKINKTSISKVGGSSYFLIPFRIIDDTSFPFSDSDSLIMRIDDRRIIIEKNGQD